MDHPCEETCAECQRLRPDYERALDEKTRLDELLRIGLDYLGEGSVTVAQLRQAARDAERRLETVRLALQEHQTTHK